MSGLSKLYLISACLLGVLLVLVKYRVVQETLSSTLLHAVSRSEIYLYSVKLLKKKNHRSINPISPAAITQSTSSIMSGNGDFNQNFYSFPDQQPNSFHASSSLFQGDSTVFSDDRSYLGFASVYDGLQPGRCHLREEILGFSDDATTMEDDTSFVADPAVVVGGGIYATNSPMTSSSNDAAGEVIKEEYRQQEKDCGDVDEATKNVCSNMKKKAEKLPRFAFLTKSDNEQLEDGYRWRKYGQKNVKNSPHPRSYYRCTTRNCPVKKRVERMLENPSTVITTYEGQHIHPYPVTPAHKGNSHHFSPPSTSSPSLNRQKPSGMQPRIYYQQNGESNHGVCLPTNKTSTSATLQHKPPLPSLEFPIDFGFLEDDVPTSFRI